MINLNYYFATGSELDKKSPRPAAPATRPTTTAATQADRRSMKRDEAITNFMAVTGSDHARAKAVLESCNWDVNQAVALHFADDGGAGGAGTAAAAAVAAAGGEESEEVRAAMPTKRMRLVTTHDPYADVAADFRPGRTTVANPFANYSGEARGGRGAGGGLGAGAPARSFAQMYAPPRGLLYSGDFSMAKRAATKHDRWLLVNIQDVEDFASHQLNRDTWKDDLVRELISYNCVFWQSDVAVLDAAKYMNLYNVQRAGGVPHIAMIDPVTGAKMWSLTGFVDPDAMMTRLSDFLEKYEKPSSMSKPPPRARARASGGSAGAGGGTGGGGDGPVPPALTKISGSALENAGAHEVMDDGFSPSVFSNNSDDFENDDDKGSSNRSSSDSSSGSSDSDSSDSDSDSDNDDNNSSNQQAAVSSANDGAAATAVVVAGARPLPAATESSAAAAAATLLPAAAPSAPAAVAAAPVTAGAAPTRARGAGVSGGASCGTARGVGDGGELGAEPPKGAPGATTMQIKFPGGRTVRRRFRAAQPVNDVFRFVGLELGLDATASGAQQRVEIMVYPRKDLGRLRHQTLASAGLRNSALTVRLLDE